MLRNERAQALRAYNKRALKLAAGEGLTPTQIANRICHLLSLLEQADDELIEIADANLQKLTDAVLSVEPEERSYNERLYIALEQAASYFDAVADEEPQPLDLEERKALLRSLGMEVA